MLKHDESIGREIRTLDNLMMRNLLAHVKKAGLDEITVMHGWILHYLYDNKTKEIFQRDIESEFCIARSTVTSILKLMEKKGYIRRISVPSDARLKKLELTKKGEQLHESTVLILDRLRVSLTEGIGEEELEAFYRVIGKLKDNLEKQKGELDVKDVNSTSKGI